jgi:hypothetical protein
MVGQSYAIQLGVRFKALRVHRECNRVYHEIDSQAATTFVPRIRLDHYYPWLFTQDFPLSGATLRALAVGNVLLSDSVNGTLRALRGGGPAGADAKAHTHQSLLTHAVGRLDDLLGDDASFVERRARVLEEQSEALLVERQMFEGRRLLSDAEAERHAAGKVAYLKVALLAMGHLCGRTRRAESLAFAQDRLSVALDLYNAFIHWRQEVCAYPVNRVLNILRERGHDMRDQDRLAHLIYETDLREQIFHAIIQACRDATGCEYESQPFRQIIGWLTERAERLREDLGRMQSEVKIEAV